MDQSDELSSYTRIYSVANSEFCPVSGEVLMYDWDFKQFAKLEYYVDFSEDRRKWAERDAERVSKMRPQG